MQRITVTLTDEQAARLRREAKRRSVSLSAVVREKVEPESESTEPRVIPWAGIFDSGKRNLARDIDEELAKTWADDIIRHRG